MTKTQNLTHFCPFCSLNEINKRVIIENDLAKAFPTNIPIVPGHILIVPIRHVATLNELTGKELSGILQLQEKLKIALQQVYGAEGFNYAFNEGKIAGQSVPHFHLHLLPRKKGDTGITKYEPRKFLYRPGSREVSSEKELIAVANQIKEVLE